MIRKKRKGTWRRLAVLLTTGGLTLQVDTCTQATQFITATSTAVTAGGVLYIVNRIIRD